METLTRFSVKRPAMTTASISYRTAQPAQNQSLLLLRKPAKGLSSKSGPKRPLPKGTHRPRGWKKILDIMRELRAQRDAPVDFFGTEQLGDKSMPRDVWAYQTLVAVMLSSQTKDVTTAQAMGVLQKHGLNMDNIHKNTTVAQLDQMISKIGFHRTKAENIKAATAIMLKEHGGQVPESSVALMRLPGVGPKMAHIVKTTITGKADGIAVDTHVHRMVNQLGWAQTKDPNQTQKTLESWLPHKEWATFNLLFVGIGQQTQTEKTKILQRCLHTREPVNALRLLVKFGLPLTYKDKFSGETVLFWAAASGLSSVVKWLLEAEKREGVSVASVRTKNVKGQTAAAVARDGLVQVLLTRAERKM